MCALHKITILKRESVVQRKEILRQFILPYTLKDLKIDPRVEMLLKRYEFKYSTHGRQFVCKLSPVLRRNFAIEQSCLFVYLPVYQTGK